jgi:hypothetical protein
MSNPDTLNELFKEIRKSKFVTESGLTSRVLFCFIFIALISKLIFSSFNSGDPYGSNGIATINIMSYLVIIVSLVALVFTSVILKMHQDDDDMKLLKLISWDLIVMIIYLFWIISINMKYYKNINLNRVPQGFFLYSNLTHGVITLQLFFYMLNYIIQLSENIDGDTSFVEKIKRLHYLLMVLNFLLILIQQIILENFTVDIA